MNSTKDMKRYLDSSVYLALSDDYMPDRVAKSLADAEHIAVATYYIVSYNMRHIVNPRRSKGMIKIILYFGYPSIKFAVLEHVPL